MSGVGQDGQTTAEYAIIAAVLVVVFAALTGLAQPKRFGAWLEAVNRAILVSRTSDVRSVVREAGER